jgi:hypothetical protein
MYLAFSMMLFAKHPHEHGKKDRDGACYFEDRDVRVIHEYYSREPRKLPPGLQKKLYRTGRLPPGWERKMQPLPVVVERQLTPCPPDYRRGFIDGQVVVYNPRTQVILDISAVFGR